jgi:rubrerythrin
MINYVDKMADAIVDVLKYSDQSVPWPDAEHVDPDPAIKPEWFYPALQSSDASEIIAILLYTQQAGLYDDEIGDLVLGVGLVEMKHFANIRDTIVSLGGELPQPVTGANLKLGDTVGEALAINVQSEYDTILFYEDLKKKITSQTETAKTILAMLDKIIADETLHLRLFVEQLHKLQLTELISDLSGKLYEKFPALRPQ